ncbi:hypothetical protein [Marinococcus luteus]|uniref:hypothetical protein n=1 Tax=Marinococcus luteus TaxID=1122204 RepID=UPI002ACC88B0|nr:hypothetical protein [Marinococcus luteus]MDZ5782098.1 hypothetical protein [Marinococcus luteus]
MELVLLANVKENLLMDPVLLAALISGIGVILSALISGYVARRTASKREYINTITVERANWINNLREQFIEINDLLERSRDYTPLIARNKERLKQLRYLHNQIDLQMNPSELTVKEHQKIILDNIGKLSQSSIKYISHKKYINYLQQVILKSEWSRLKVEAIKGEEIKKIENLSIVITTAHKINKTHFEKSLKKDFSNEFKELNGEVYKETIPVVKEALNLVEND